MRRMPPLFPLILWSLAVSGQTPEAGGVDVYEGADAAGAREPANGR